MGAKPQAGSFQQMRLRHERSALGPQVVEDLLVVHSLVDHRRDPSSASRSACRSRSGCSSPACRSRPCRCRCRPCTCSRCSPGTTRSALPSSACGRCPADSRCPALPWAAAAPIKYVRLPDSNGAMSRPLTTRVTRVRSRHGRTSLTTALTSTGESTRVVGKFPGGPGEGDDGIGVQLTCRVDRFPAHTASTRGCGRSRRSIFQFDFGSHFERSCPAHCLVVEQSPPPRRRRARTSPCPAVLLTAKPGAALPSASRVFRQSPSAARSSCRECPSRLRHRTA